MRAALTHPLKNPLFFALWLASCLSVLGTTLQEVAASWMMTGLHPSPFMVSLVSVASSLPLFLLVIPAGALADLVDRRRYLMLTQTWMMLMALWMGWLTLTGELDSTRLLCLTFLLGLGAALNSPGWHAVTPEIVTRNQLPAAIAYNGTAITTARTLGPVLGGWVVSHWGAGSAFLLNALSFLGVVLVLATWRRRRRRQHAPAERFMSAVRMGLRYQRHSPQMRAVLSRTLLFVVPASAPYALLPLLVKDTYAAGPEQFGLLVTAFGIGSVLGSALTTPLRRACSPNLLVTLASLGYAVALGIMAAWPRFEAGCLAQGVAGLSWLLALNQLHLGTQMSVPDWVRARATSVYLLVLFGGSSLGGLVWGILAQASGMGPSLGVAAVTAALASAAYWLAPMPVEPPDFTPKPHWPHPEVTGDYSPDAGPVLVKVEYRVREEDAQAFRRAMRPLRRFRARMGVLRWGLFVDMENPERYTEVYLEESWAAHLRHHERLTAEEQAVAEEAYRYHIGPEAAPVIHLVYADSAFEGH